MFNIIFIGITILSTAYAQPLRLGSLFRGSSQPSDISIQWNCPQHKYPKIRQLREKSQVRVRFTEKDGVLTTELKPDIFKVNPLSLSNALTHVTGQVSMTVDYDDCLKEFQTSLSLAVELKKDSQVCAQAPNEIVCRLPLSELDQNVQSRIDHSPYFEKRENQQKLPRQLPLESRGLSSQEVSKILQDFRRGNEVSNEELYSKEVFDFISQRPGFLSESQLTRYQQSFSEYKIRFKNDTCDGSSPVCEHIEDELAAVDSKIKSTTTQQMKALINYNDPSLISLNVPLDETEATEQLAQLLEAEPFDCNFMNQSLKSGGRVYAASYFSQALSQNMSRLAQRADSDCISRVMQNYSFAMSYMPELSEGFKKKCDSQWTQACALAAKRREIIEGNLRTLWELNFGERGTEYLSGRGDISCMIQSATPDRLIKDILADHRKSLGCIELETGEAKPVSFRDGTPSGLYGEYALKKKDNGDHEVLVNINIKDDNFGVSKTEMHSRIQSCMNDASPFMKGPDGKKLDFKILTPDETLRLPSNERPGVNQVSIQAPNSRSNSRSYAANINCPTIAHEVLHLLGLCDEYNGVLDGYKCRAVAQVPSIMSNQNEVYRNGMSRTHTCECRPGSICERVRLSQDNDLKRMYLQPSVYSITDPRLRNAYCEFSDIPDSNWQNLNQKDTVVITQQTETLLVFNSQNMTDYPWPRIGVSKFTCRCSDPADTKCITDLASLAKSIQDIDLANLEMCPSSSYSIKTEYGELIESPAVWNDKGVTFVQKASLPSLLHPSHYERIIGGACASKAKKYNDCAQWAYKDYEKTNQCEGKPEYCDNGKEFLGLGP